MAVAIAALQAENHESGFAIAHSRPRLSWRFASSSVRNWTQVAYDVVIIRDNKEESYHVQSSLNVLVPWPSSPLVSRERAGVKVRAIGSDGTASAWATMRIEVALLDRSDWQAEMISRSPVPVEEPKRPFQLRSTFHLSSLPTPDTPVRLYATAFGIYDVTINSRRVGDQVLTPGWQSYNHRLAYQTFDARNYLCKGSNEIVVELGEGWFAGRLGKTTRNIWGERLGWMGQLEIGGQVVLRSQEDRWTWGFGQVVESEIYNGEVVDTSLPLIGPAQGPAERLASPKARLVSPDAPPIRRVMEIKPIQLITTPSGAKILDFGQNLVGWLRLERDVAVESNGEGDIVLRHAEVLEQHELGVRPLRTAMCRDIIRGGGTKGWQVRFTFHGFRYAEVTGIADLSLSDFTAIVVASDLRRTGTFASSHKEINQLHQNVVWGMRGNFVSIPTDCPQRDERLGWTGDIQVFAPTANFLFDTDAFLGDWLKDVAAEQELYDGVPPIFVPWTPPPKEAVNPLGGHRPRPHAIWADLVALTPWDLHMAFGDRQILERQFDSMMMWLDKGLPRNELGMWSESVAQYGDWLDPKAPPQYPAHGRTDFLLAANAYLVHVTSLVARIARLIGRPTEADRYQADFERLRVLFQKEYVTPNGRLASDTQTALTLALKLDLLDKSQRAHAAKRLDWLIRWDFFKISTGFAGTPLLLHALAENGLLHLAYRMLQEKDCPSWLYSVGMGATTIVRIFSRRRLYPDLQWERWDSQLPDGRINPGQMTSFNHYALGSVAAFLHAVVGGLAPAAPGWKRALVHPQPGGTVTSASTAFESRYGPYRVNWKLLGHGSHKTRKMMVEVHVPPNGEAQVLLPGVDEVVGSGRWDWTVDWATDQRWPPVGTPGPQSTKIPDQFVS
ncbi:uncharacterized protein EHS24_007290 [Apiotrichum porosum]|uniref:alpha-L-rhamnosidase n=1 Tax=Apiotrichum porosum TaxID=105984 RepID=A0A427XU09_9TREE|nr:uncharacterized protein EHS24_007290 [Apiotrichum porosum]RSH82323.1 hypothetical protein EHS24_007290 [Apiotrichum porosum]